MKKLRIMQCKICNIDIDTYSIVSHLNRIHNLTSDEYAEKYGEFRINKLKAKPILEKTIDCKECKEMFDTDHKLGLHLKFTHKMTRHEYIIKHDFDGIFPVCKCGCGQQVSKIHMAPYFRDYISGHNDSTLGYKFSDESKSKMSESAKKRFVEYNSSETMHNNEARLKSHYKTLENYIEFLKNKNITLLGDKIKSINKFKCDICGNEWYQTSLQIKCTNCK